MGHSNKTQTKLKQLRKIVAGAKSAYILIYSNPDPDGLASAWALKELLDGMGVTATIGYTGEVGRLQNAAMIKFLGLPAEALKRDLLLQADLVSMVDAQPHFFQEIVLPRTDIVIDHHPARKDKTVPFSDIRTQCLATASILTDYLIISKTPINKRLATALYYGIWTDSGGQNRTPSGLDRAALEILEKKADRNLLRRIEFSQYSLNDLDYFSMALIKHRYAHNVLYAHIGPVPFADVCSQVADFLIRVQEAHWALVTGVAGNKLVIVFRCDGIAKNAGKVAEAAFGEIGSAGGHRTMGRAELLGSSLPQGTSLTQNERLEWFVVNCLARVDRAFRPLLKNLQAEGLDKTTIEEIM